MNKQLSVVIPYFSSNSSENSEEDDIFFEGGGTPEEILILGPKVPIASILSRQKNTIPKMCIELVHLHATRDHLVLMDPKLLNIQASEELALRESVSETIDHFLGTVGEYSSHRWIFPANTFIDLQTHSPSQANGLNIDIWMPKDTKTEGVAKHWRKLQNEIQMIWHDHPINEARLNRGELPINSVWIYGLGSLEDVSQDPLLHGARRIFSNHYLGSALDSRIHTISDFQVSDPIHEHDFLFAQDLSTSEWDRCWNACVELLFNQTVSKIQLLKMHGKIIDEHTLTLQSIQSNLFTKLFLSKKTLKQRLSVWQDYSKNIRWTHLKSI